MNKYINKVLSNCKECPALVDNFNCNLTGNKVDLDKDFPDFCPLPNAEKQHAHVDGDWNEEIDFESHIWE